MPKAYIDNVLVDVTEEYVATSLVVTPVTEGLARSKRDELIASTDAWALSDRTMTAEQTAYRQALRDITGQAGFPTNITWPTKP
mgnify:CR=1 FL=1